MNEPPPAMAFIAPASNPAAVNGAASCMAVSVLAAMPVRNQPHSGGRRSVRA
jgi:hypothetical protein